MSIGEPFSLTYLNWFSETKESYCPEAAQEFEKLRLAVQAGLLMSIDAARHRCQSGETDERAAVYLHSVDYRENTNETDRALAVASKIKSDLNSRYGLSVNYHIEAETHSNPSSGEIDHYTQHIIYTARW